MWEKIKALFQCRTAAAASVFTFRCHWTKIKALECDADQFNSKPLHGIHAKCKRRGLNRNRVMRLLHSRFFSFQSFFHVVCLCSLVKNVFVCVCVLQTLKCLYLPFICTYEMKAHARTYSHPKKKTRRTENRWISIGAFYFQTSRTSCHIMNINNDVTIRFVFFFVSFICFFSSALWMRWTKYVFIGPQLKWDFCFVFCFHSMETKFIVSRHRCVKYDGNFPIMCVLLSSSATNFASSAGNKVQMRCMSWNEWIADRAESVWIER